jgi:Holliday junction resolvasome RuvABC DNA-binding subunit
MAKIESINCSKNDGIKLFEQHLNGMENSALAAQEISQNSAIHTIEALLKLGCNEETALKMLSGLRCQAKIVSEKIIERGFRPAFETDQTSFN